jgi:hypothetical protein
MTAKSKSTVVYNSGLNIWEPSDLSTLTIFYDQVLVPWSTRQSCGEMVEFVRKKGKPEDYRLGAFEVENLSFTDGEGQSHKAHDVALEWEHRHRLLFRESVLMRVSPPATAQTTVHDWFESPSLSRLADMLLDVPYTFHSTTGELERIWVWQDHLKHLLRTDVSERGVFLCRPNSSQRERYKSLMAHAAFRFVLPRIGELNPEQILEVRDLVRDTREGFSMHLQSLSADVEKQVKGGVSLQEVSAAAGSVVETQLIPLFAEYRRQLAAKKGGFWRKVLDPLGRMVPIDAAPWTPKFYGELLRALGVTLLTGIEQRKDSLSNKTQALQFMKTIDDWTALSANSTKPRGR